MIDDLDQSIESLLHLEFGATLPFDLSFARPDRAFAPLTNTQTTLDCYLFEIQEDRELRRVAPTITNRADGTFERTPPPVRVRASYCLTAWSPAQSSAGGTPERDEHALLSKVLAALLRHPTLPNAALVGSLANQEPPPPTTVIRPGGAAAGSEFWTALGGQLRPSLDYSVRVSMPYQPPSLGPFATTVISSYGILSDQNKPDQWIAIGGVITDNTPNAAPVPQARVLLTEQPSQRQLVAVTDTLGRFAFDRVAAGTHTLRARATGFFENSRTLDVAEPTGDYTLQLTAIP